VLTIKASAVSELDTDLFNAEMPVAFAAVETKQNGGVTCADASAGSDKRNENLASIKTDECREKFKCILTRMMKLVCFGLTPEL
jgi:hypothetical protein